MRKGKWRWPFKNRFTRVPHEPYAKTTLKEKAILCAVDVGVIQDVGDGTGYNVEPFLKFWDKFSLLLCEEIKEVLGCPQEIVKMVEEHRNDGADE